MNFEYELQRFDSESLQIEYFYVPWDTELMSRPVAQLQKMTVLDQFSAIPEMRRFLQWMDDRDIAFCTARLPHEAVVESAMLQNAGFRFIELNYRPELDPRSRPVSAPGFCAFEIADEKDRDLLCNMASKIFNNTRFHVDPMIGKAIADARYRAWMDNAFDREDQEVVKCMENGQIMAFFVQERPAESEIFWSLVGLAPGLQGKRLAKAIWTAALSWLAELGTVKVSTSISSLNTPVLNLYARLGFRLPDPSMVFHFHRQQSVQ